MIIKEEKTMERAIKEIRVAELRASQDSDSEEMILEG